jgi:hypothetical protein
MENRRYLIVIVSIFIVDQMIMTPFLSYNEDESDKPKSKGLGYFMRSIIVSDGADEEGSTKNLTDNSISAGAFILKAGIVGWLVKRYMNSTGDSQSTRTLQVLTMAIIFILGIKYVAYAGWFDDKRCANAYVSGFASDHPEDIVFKIIYAVFSIILAILIRSKPFRTSGMTMGFIVGLPFILYAIHYVGIRLMLLGCEDTRKWFSDNDCAISPATFYRNYAVGSVKESNTGSKSWDIYKRIGLLGVCLIATYSVARKRILPSKFNTPMTFVGISVWLAYGLPLFLNWFTTMDMERQVARKKTNEIKQEGETQIRNYKGIRCVPNKYGGISGYFLLLCIQFAIIFPKLL